MMEVLQILKTHKDERLKAKIKKAIDIINRTLDLYTADCTAFSFNGGKDSTVLLHLIRAAVASRQLQQEQDKSSPSSSNGTITTTQDISSTPLHLGGILTFFFNYSSDFSEVTSFTKSTDTTYNLNMHILQGDFKKGLEGLLASQPIKAIFIGTRKGDPNAGDQEFFCPSSFGWPPFMRVNPILDWEYHEVWSFLLSFCLPYCHLYDEGYTSLGSVASTQQNEALLKEDGTYAPAYALPDARLERAGRFSRASIERQRTTSLTRGGGIIRTACLIVIGDELLRGTVGDVNMRYLCSELRAIGWRVSRAVFVRDDTEAISKEVRAASCEFDIVLTSGGIGPTVDDVTMGAVADALNAPLIRNPVLEVRIRNKFGLNTTEAHLKMADSPGGSEVSIIEEYSSDDESNGGNNKSSSDASAPGQPSPFPLIRCRNVYILPGVPDYLRRKFNAVKRELVAGQPMLLPFQSVLLRLPVQDETQIAAALEHVNLHSGSDVCVGSYPLKSQKDGAGIVVSFECKDEGALQKAKNEFLGKLPSEVKILSEHKNNDAEAMHSPMAR